MCLAVASRWRITCRRHLAGTRNQRLRPGPLELAFDVRIGLQLGRSNSSAHINLVAFQRVPRRSSLYVGQDFADVLAVTAGDRQRLAFLVEDRFAGAIKS